jgi:hypothetical protein
MEDTNEYSSRQIKSLPKNVDSGELNLPLHDGDIQTRDDSNMMKSEVTNEVSILSAKKIQIRVSGTSFQSSQKGQTISVMNPFLQRIIQRNRFGEIDTLFGIQSHKSSN